MTLTKNSHGSTATQHKVLQLTIFCNNDAKLLKKLSEHDKFQCVQSFVVKMINCPWMNLLLSAH